MRRGRKQFIYRVRICKACGSDWIGQWANDDLTYWCSRCQKNVRTKVIKTKEIKQ